LKLRNALRGTAVPTPLMLVHLMSASGMPSRADGDDDDRRESGFSTRPNARGSARDRQCRRRVAAFALYLLLAINSTIISLTLLTLMMARAFGWRVTAGDRRAAVVLVAFNSVMIVLSSSLLSDEGALAFWVGRLTQFAIAGAFAVEMMILLWPAKERRTLQAPPAGTHDFLSHSGGATHGSDERNACPRCGD
jgi:hypothetical protein